MIALVEDRYKISYDSKTFFCNRATRVIKGTEESPIAIDRWRVNLAVNAVYAINQRRNIAQLDIRLLKNAGWKAHIQETDYACAIGTEVHHNIDQKWTDAVEFASADSCQAYTGFKKWVKDYGVIPLAQEFSVFNLDLSCAGTVDLLCSIDGVLYLVDFKTSSAIRESHLVQISLYKYMFEALIKDFQLGRISDPRLMQAVNQVLQNTRSKKPKFKLGVLQLKKDSTKNYRKPYVFKVLSPKEIQYHTKTAKLKCQLYKHLTKGLNNGR